MRYQAAPLPDGRAIARDEGGGKLAKVPRMRGLRSPSKDRLILAGERFGDERGLVAGQAEERVDPGVQLGLRVGDARGERGVLGAARGEIAVPQRQRAAAPGFNARTVGPARAR